MEGDKKEEVKYYKVLNRDLTHNGFKYQLGLNIDSVPFNPTACEVNDFDYTTKEYLSEFLDYGCYIADVSIPDDAKVYEDPDGNKWKADKIIIDKITWMGEHELWKDMEFLLTVDANKYDFTCLTCDMYNLVAKIKEKPVNIMFVKNQTYAFCLAAVKQNYKAIRYVKEQTPELCQIAVERDWRALEFIQNQTPELCMIAINQSPMSFQFVKDQTYELYQEFVQQPTVYSMSYLIRDPKMRARFELHAIYYKSINL